MSRSPWFPLACCGLISIGSATVARWAVASEVTPAASASPASGKMTPLPTNGVREIDWDALVPERERANYNAAPPPPKHDYLGEGGPGAAQSGSAAINPKLNGARVKIPGFVVPLDISGEGVTHEFLLVPYLGACIHVPPPAPNQIVYVRMPQGMRLHTLYDAVWLTGQMHAETKRLRMASAAYTLDAEKFEIYKY